MNEPIKLRLNTPGEMEAMVEYIEEALQYIQGQFLHAPKGSSESLEYQAHAELLEQMLRKLKIKQMDGKNKASISLLKMQALILIRYNQAVPALNPYAGNVVMGTSFEIHKQLLNRN